MMTEKPRSPPVVSEHRKVTKSAMEKKRRARINSSLTELKSILAGIMTFKEEKFEKLEKADILEMTVNYVRQLQNKSVESDTTIHRDGDDYRTGVNSCIGEVIRYMTSSEVCDTDTKTKLLDHLANRVNNLSTTQKSPCLPSPQNNTVDRVHCTETVDVPVADANNNVMDTSMVKQTSPISVCTASQKQFDSLQTISAYTPPQMVSPINSLQSSLTAVSVQNIQRINPVCQSSPQLMSNVPLTILVPANFCTTTTGTTCVIPVTWSNPVPQESNVVFNPSVCTVGRDINQEQNGNNTVTVTNVDHNTMDVDTDAGVPQKELRVSESSDTNNIPDISESPVNLSRSQTHQFEAEVLQTKQHHTNVDRVGGNTNPGLVDRVSKNISKSPTVSELPRSEYSVFQKYESRKSVSPFHRANSMWRPW